MKGRLQTIVLGSMLMGLSSLQIAQANALPEIEFLRADQTITDASATPVNNHIASSGPILDADGLPLEGNLDVIFKLNAGASNHYVVAGETVAPGGTVTVKHDFSATSGALNLPVHVSGAGTVSADDYELTIINPGLLVWEITPTGYANTDPFAPQYPRPQILPDGNIITRLDHLRDPHIVIFTPSGDPVAAYQFDNQVRFMGTLSDGHLLFNINDGYSWMMPGATELTNTMGYYFSRNGGEIAGEDTVIQSDGNRFYLYDLTSFQQTVTYQNDPPGYWSGYEYRKRDWFAVASNNGKVGLATEGQFKTFDRGYTSAPDDGAILRDDAILYPDFLVKSSGEAYKLGNVPAAENGTGTYQRADADFVNNKLYLSGNNKLFIVPINNPDQSLITTKEICKNGQTFRLSSVNLNKEWALGSCGVAAAVAVNLAIPELFEPPQSPVTVTPMTAVSVDPFILNRDPGAPSSVSSKSPGDWRVLDPSGYVLNFL